MSRHARTCLNASDQPARAASDLFVVVVHDSVIISQPMYNAASLHYEAGLLAEVAVSMMGDCRLSHEATPSLYSHRIRAAVDRVRGKWQGRDASADHMQRRRWYANAAADDNEIISQVEAS